MSLWLCLRLHRLPLESLEHGRGNSGTGDPDPGGPPDEAPVVVIQRQRVLCANDSAAGLGIRPGMGTATARALAEPQPLRLWERDEAAEERCREQLCCWAYGITPSLHPWRADCLLLEIGSCLTLFRGLAPLLAEVDCGLARRGYSARLGLAETPRAAWLLSHAEQAAMTCERPLAQRLASLPLTLLEDEFSTAVHALRRAGLHTLGDILSLPAAALGRRCGRNFVASLDRVMGRELDQLPAFTPPTRFDDAHWYGYEVRANAELLPAIQVLLQSLCLFLRHTQLSAAELEWQLTGVDGSVHRMTVRSSCSQGDWQSWYRLTRIHLDRLQLRVGVEGLSLHCDQLRAGEQPATDLFAGAGQKEPLGSLLDRLRSRLGLQAVQQVGCRDEHLPEFAARVGNEVADGASTTAPACAQRPFWLMPQPQPLASPESFTLLHGPERIEDNWWQEPVCRDYYIGRGKSGELYWLFYDRRGRQWYLQGIFA